MARYSLQSDDGMFAAMRLENGAATPQLVTKPFRYIWKHDEPDGLTPEARREAWSVFLREKLTITLES